MENPPYIRNLDGDAIHIRGDVFMDQCATGLACFLCGKAKSGDDSEFDREHVIPKWLLKTSELLAATIIMPNHQRVRYSRLTVPCCKHCNKRLACVFENPISIGHKNSIYRLAKLFARNDFELSHKWSSLILLKFALHDMKWRRDVSDPNSPSIASFYDWNEIHHLSCIARTAISGFDIHPDAIGSILIVRTEEFNFNLTTNMHPLSIMLSIDGLCLISVPCDGTYAAKLHRDLVRRIQGLALSRFQSLELFCRYTAAASLLWPRLVFETIPEGVIQIRGSVPFSFHPGKEKLRRAYGRLLDYYLSTQGVYGEKSDIDQIKVLKGEFTFFSQEIKSVLPTT